MTFSSVLIGSQQLTIPQLVVNFGHSNKQLSNKAIKQFNHGFSRLYLQSLSGKHIRALR